MGVESILDVLVGMSGAGVNAVHLGVHYRSQHDTLIRYSNHYFDDRLLTFPSALLHTSGSGHPVYLSARSAFRSGWKQNEPYGGRAERRASDLRVDGGTAVNREHRRCGFIATSGRSHPGVDRPSSAVGSPI